MANIPFWVRSGDLERFWPKTTDMAVFYIKMGRNMVVIEYRSFFLENGSKLGKKLDGRVIMPPHVSLKNFKMVSDQLTGGLYHPGFVSKSC